jgi:uncharacterized protein involved in type VI secretion and phage assembly
MHELERAVAGLVREAGHRYLGKYRGIVKENADPEHLARVKVTVPSLFGEDVVTGWALPCVPAGGMPGQGWFMVPRKGAGVWVEFEEGDLEFPIVTGTFWSAPDGTPEVPVAVAGDGSDAGVSDPPTRTILTTAKGHTIQIEDAEDAELILIRDKTHDHTVLLNADGIRITDGAGNEIVMTATAFTVHSETALTIEAPGQPLRLVADTIDLEQG